MRRFLIFFYSIYYRFYFTNKFLKRLKNENKDIYIFDIDNTVADTWISFLQNYSSTKDRLSSLAIFYNMRKYILRLKNEGHCVIYLTARQYFYCNLTFNWLRDMDLIQDKNDLFLVSKPMEKIKLLKLVEKSIVFYDDMTYNHEKGEVKYYNVEIEMLKNMHHIKYYDIKSINKIIQGRNND